MNRRYNGWRGSIGPACLAVLAAVLLGCGSGGPTRAPVKGMVTWNGEPVADGTIAFIPLADGTAVSAKIVGGRYALAKAEGPVVGVNRVEIMGIKRLGPQEAGPPHPPGTIIEATEQYIPTQYNNTSTLSVEIKAEENTQDFELPPKK